MNFKKICIIFISMHFLYSESNFSIALRDGKSIGLYSGFHKWEYYDKNIDTSPYILTSNKFRKKTRHITQRVKIYN